MVISSEGEHHVENVNFFRLNHGESGIVSGGTASQELIAQLQSVWCWHGVVFRESDQKDMYQRVLQHQKKYIYMYIYLHLLNMFFMFLSINLDSECQ